MRHLQVPYGDSGSVQTVGAVAPIDRFHPRSSGHRPRTMARVVHSGRAIHLRFEVADRYVRANKTQFQEMVCTDSCVEFFVQPKPDSGYFNFEFNCGGTLLVYYVRDPARLPGGALREFTPLTQADAAAISITTNLRTPIEPEITEPTDWWLKASLPLEVMERYVGPFGNLSGQTWRANFMKCGDETSRPHWGMWSDVGEALNFHQPATFGRLTFL